MLLRKRTKRRSASTIDRAAPHVYRKLAQHRKLTQLCQRQTRITRRYAARKLTGPTLPYNPTFAAW